MSEEYTKNQMNYRRSKGVSRAWAKERELVSKGRGTREWTVAEQKELLRTGRVKGYQGHHMKSVSDHPQYADDPKNIQFLDSRKGNNEHLKAHKGDYRNESDGRYNVKSGKIRPMNEGKPRAMNSYELKDKAIEKRGYTKYAANQTADRTKINAVGNKAPSSRRTASSAKTKTEFNGKNYNRSMVKSGKLKEQTQRSKPSVTRAQGNKSTPQKYGAKASRVPESSAQKTNSYGRKASSTVTNAKSSGSYGKKTSGAGKAQSGNKMGGSSGSKSKGVSSQRR